MSIQTRGSWSSPPPPRKEQRVVPRLATMKAREQGEREGGQKVCRRVSRFRNHVADTQELVESFRIVN